MSERPVIRRLDWDDWNREHITKHDVTVEEVAEILESNWFARRTYKDRTLLIGFAESRRMLAVVIGPVPDQENAFYVFSARPASRKERREYDEYIGGGKP